MAELRKGRVYRLIEKLRNKKVYHQVISDCYFIILSNVGELSHDDLVQIRTTIWTSLDYGKNARDMARSISHIDEHRFQKVVVRIRRSSFCRITID